MSVSVKFLGASGTVTGSKYLISTSRNRILVDAGVFQGEHEWREKNWDPFERIAGISAREIDAVLLTHGHIDHVGYLPRLVAQGLRCPVYATPATIETCNILLPDFAEIQEEDAEHRARHSLSRHHPPLPLYTAADVKTAMQLMKPVGWGGRPEIVSGLHATWAPMGHILGAGSIQVEVDNRTITFSGDIGRYGVPLFKDPVALSLGDLLLIESTYGDRDHPSANPEDFLAKVINDTVGRKGVLVIPSFAVGRAQILLHLIWKLKERREIPDIPILLDSPMAQDATAMYIDQIAECDDEISSAVEKGKRPFAPSKLRFVKSKQDSKDLNSKYDSMIIISASGMLTGGRVLHHVFHRIGSPRNTILFVGHQAHGTLGDRILKGEPEVRIFKQMVPVRAQIASLEGLSAHAGRDELLRWCRESIAKGQSPGKVAVVHGEPEVSRAFADTLKSEFAWNAFLPDYMQEVVV